MAALRWGKACPGAACPQATAGCCSLLRELPHLPQQGRVGWLCPTKSKESVLLRKAQGLGKQACGKLLLKLTAEGWGQAGELQGVVRVGEPGEVLQVCGLSGAAEGWGMAALPRPRQLHIPAAGGWREPVRRASGDLAAWDVGPSPG